MNRIVKTALGAVAVVALSAPSAAAAEEIRRDYDRSFDVGPGDRLLLEHGDGDVEIAPWDRDVLEVKVRYRVDAVRIGIGWRGEFEVEFRQEGNTVRVTGKEPSSGGFGFFFSRGHEHRYEIRAPAYLGLELRGDDGDVTIGGWRGDLEVDLEDGDVVLSDVRNDRTGLRLDDGDVSVAGFAGKLSVLAEDGSVRLRDCELSGARIRLEDGDMVARDCGGSAYISVEDGDVNLTRFRAGTLEVLTGDGDVDLDLLRGEDMEVDVRTRDGDVVVALEPGTSARFSVDTGDGRIRINLPDAAELVQGRREASGRLGDGRGRIRISTGDGSVSLLQASG